MMFYGLNSAQWLGTDPDIMKILAIDTSCDDTSVAVAGIRNNKVKILSNIVSSQIKIHAPYGGVYPALAKREHQRNLAPVLKKALQQASLLRPTPLPQAEEWGGSEKFSNFQTLKKILQRDGELLEKTAELLFKYQKPRINAIAVTNGPGLEPCLWQGVNFAKSLAFWWDLPLIPVNHIKAHLSANWLWKAPSAFGGRRHSVPSTTIPKFPAIGLVASGGHTELVLMQQPNKYKLIGATRDDAAGECFDKTARILGLPYPGGPAIAALAAIECKVQSAKCKVELPRPMINSDDFDFSFSGLKTAVLYDWKKRKKSVKESQEYKILMAKEIQQAIIDVLIAKTIKAAKRFKVKNILLGGGVASNKNLRQQFKVQSLKFKVNLFVPEKKLCLDNAAMVAAEALMAKPKMQSPSRNDISNGVNWRKIKVNANLNI